MNPEIVFTTAEIILIISNSIGWGLVGYFYMGR